MLVPTTLLAEQHFSTFKDRFAPWPIKIEELSRFRNAKEVRATLDGLAEGNVDLVIGTHKLIQPDIKFKNLGLVIIDEEHRFGVRQKEQLKKLRAEVDVLTLTATPIPRTLAMSLEGIRDFSVIATAPQKRLAIKTFVAKRAATASSARRSCANWKRGGQVFSCTTKSRPSRTCAKRLEASCPRRACVWATARWRARAGRRDARLLPAALPDPAVLDHHRDRYRRRQRQHHPDQPRRQVRPWRNCTSCAGASVARIIRPMPTC